MNVPVISLEIQSVAHHTIATMAIDKETLIRDLQELVKNAKVPECPKFFEDERLEDAFKTPVTDENGYGEYE